MAKKKTFDTVTMVRRIRDAHHEHLKEKNVEERLAFYREKSKALHAEIAQRQQKR